MTKSRRWRGIRSSCGSRPRRAPTRRIFRWRRSAPRCIRRRRPAITPPPSSSGSAASRGPEPRSPSHRSMRSRRDRLPGAAPRRPARSRRTTGLVLPARRGDRARDGPGCRGAVPRPALGRLPWWPAQGADRSATCTTVADAMIALHPLPGFAALWRLYLDDEPRRRLARGPGRVEPARPGRADDPGDSGRPAPRPGADPARGQVARRATSSAPTGASTACGAPNRAGPPGKLIVVGLGAAARASRCSRPCA